MDRSQLTTAEAIADAFNLNPKSYRAALRRERFDWHDHYERWLVSPGSEEQRAMIAVAERMSR
jgi:UDP-N-acetylmuramyl pentapeptide synthase